MAIHNKSHHNHALMSLNKMRKDKALKYKTASDFNVPAQICDDCGEYYLDEETAKDIYNRAEFCFSSGQEVAIIEYKQMISA